MEDVGGRKGWTNQVLLERHRQRQVYYLPCYLRLKLKNFLSLSTSTRQAEVNADLLFAVYFAGIPAFASRELQRSITLQFNRNEAVTLVRSIEVSCCRKQGLLSFTVRRRLKCAIDSDFFWAPFQLIYLSLVVTVRSISLSEPLNGAAVILRFNLMNHHKRHLKVSLTREDSFGNYRVAAKKIKVFYSKELYMDPSTSNRQQEEGNYLISLENDVHDSAQIIRQQQQDPQKLSYFQYAHFVVPMHRRPFVALFTIFVPLWSLALYSLFMYYQDNSDLSMRIANGTVIILSVFAYVPTIKDQLPSTPHLLLSQCIIYSISFTFILNLIQGTIAYHYPPDYSIQWNTDPFYIATLIINLLSVAIVIALSLLHKCKWEQEYLEEFVVEEPKFNRQEWINQQCDQYFSQYPYVKPTI